LPRRDRHLEAKDSHTTVTTSRTQTHRKKRRRCLLEKLHELAALNVDQRLISALTHLSTDRSFTTSDGRLKLENVHHRLLCEMVGATRESIALALSRLVSAGIAERKGMTFLIEPGSLKSTLGTNGDRAAGVSVAREVSR
jgi:CRP-like cAMP-binding protein